MKSLSRTIIPASWSRCSALVLAIVVVIRSIDASVTVNDNSNNLRPNNLQDNIYNFDHDSLSRKQKVLRQTRAYHPLIDDLLEAEEVSRSASIAAFEAGEKEIQRNMYNNHPYDKRNNEERRLNEDEEVWKNIRIKADVTALDSRRDGTEDMDQRVNFIRDTIIPQTMSYWSQALKVVPVEGNLQMSTSELANRLYCGDSEFSLVPPEHVTDGIPDTDLILYVSASPSSRFCPTGGSTLAVAVACNFDAFDRPTAGAINFCLDKIDIDNMDDPVTIQDNLDVAIHETGHILGMSGNSYKYFYDPNTGEPRTSRPLKSSTVTCVDNVQRLTTIPDENTMRFFIATNGQRYASIVTEKVRTVARNQFNCQTLEGGQLENQPTGSSCHGDHWDERFYYIENLSGVVSSFNNFISPLSLALFEDSGWYKANYTMSEIGSFGHAAGCDFVEQNCIIDGQVKDFGRGMFCDEAGERGCSADHTHKLACSLADYSLRYPPQPPPQQFQYFSNPNLGGPKQNDYCPVYGSTYGGKKAAELVCTDGSNTPALNLYSEVYGSDSKCVETSTGEGRCYPVQCIYDERVVKIQIRGEWKTCEDDFQSLTISSSTGLLGGTVYCPRLASVCPDLFCPKNCAGAGVCNYEAVVNGTVRPSCECFDETDTSPGCSDTVTNDGEYLQDSSKLKDTYKEDWLEPLVKVFVDDPEYWTEASWGWAAGLFCILLLLIFCVCSSFWPSRNTPDRRYK